jgi:hypothetical protein
MGQYDVLYGSYHIGLFLMRKTGIHDVFMFICVYIYIYIHNTQTGIVTHIHRVKLAPSITLVTNDIGSDFSKPHSNIGFMYA